MSKKVVVERFHLIFLRYFNSVWCRDIDNTKSNDIGHTLLRRRFVNVRSKLDYLKAIH